jgi:hypothetical protein
LIRSGHGRFWRFDEIVENESEAQSGCPVTYTYTPRTISAELRQAGFTVTDTWRDHIFPYRIPEYVRYEYRQRRIFQVMPRRFFRWLEHRMGWHLMVVAKPTPGARA